MEISFESILFALLFVDSVGANLLSWTDGKKWYRKNFRIFSRYFPLTKGWTTLYFILVLLIGSLISNSGKLF
jgi:hypothetical protein